jgi:hypothetical protein
MNVTNFPRTKITPSISISPRTFGAAFHYERIEQASEPHHDPITNITATEYKHTVFLNPFEISQEFLERCHDVFRYRLPRENAWG